MSWCRAYREGEKACGACDSCALRLRAFAEAGVPESAFDEIRALFPVDRGASAAKVYPKTPRRDG